MAIPRVLEPEAMDSAEEAAAYDAMDHEAVNRAFVADLLRAAVRAGIAPEDAVTAVDAGAGTGRIPGILAGEAPGFRILAVDLAGAMLRLAAARGRTAGGRVRLLQASATALPLAGGCARVVLANSLHHHLPDPLAATRELRRVLAPGGLLFCRDLLRPGSEADLAALVARHAARETPVQRRLFADSLRASLTLAEAAAMAEAAGCGAGSVRQTSDRHFTLAYVAPA